MRFGVIGLGSMGKRRVRDLLALGHRVVGFDLRLDRNNQAQEMFGITTVPDFEALVSTNPDALVISTPPDQHMMYYERCFAARLPFFSEANILTPRAEWFAKREADSGVRGYPSATWRFYPLFGVLRQQLQEIGLAQVNSVHYHYGGYLPFWHPWEHYEAFYAGRSRHTCAAREMVPFELEWLCWVFGPVKAVCCVQDRRADWTTDIDDTYMLLLEFESGLRGTLIIELHQVAPFRVGRVACREQSFILDMTSHELRRYDLKTDTWRFIKPEAVRSLGSFDFEQVYLAEVKTFVAALEGRCIYPKSWAEDRHLSNVLYAAEESWRRRAWVTITEVEDAYDGRTWITGNQ
jgi:predicted dehydrogenase